MTSLSLTSTLDEDDWSTLLNYTLINRVFHIFTCKNLGEKQLCLITKKTLP